MNDLMFLGEAPVGSGVFFEGLGYYKVYAKYDGMVYLKPVWLQVAKKESEENEIGRFGTVI